MRINGFNFQNEEPPSKIGDREGWRFVPREIEPCPNSIGKLVRLYLRGNSIVGIYRGLNDRGDYVLAPYLNYDAHCRVRNDGTSLAYSEVQWSKGPAYVSCTERTGMNPERKEHVKEHIREVRENARVIKDILSKDRETHQQL